MTHDIKVELNALNARVVPHSQNWAARWWGRIAWLGGVRDFADRFWITIGRDICHPRTVINPYALENWTTIRHELVHVRQQAKTWLWWWLVKYVCSGRFRWRMEREAYLVDIRAGVTSPGGVAHMLRREYWILSVRETEMARWLTDAA